MTERRSHEGAASRATVEGGEEANMFKQLCDNVNTAMINHNNTLQEFLQFKDELLKHSLPSNLLLSLTLISSRLFRSYSDLYTPAQELSRLVQLHSTPWEKKAEGLKKIRSDYENMQRRLNIALKKIELMAAEESRIQHQKILGHWERLFCHVMQADSHGRRWKFRIEPLRRKLAAGYNPYLSDSDSDVEDENALREQFMTSEANHPQTLRNDTKSNVLNEAKEEIVSPPSTPTPSPSPPVVTEDAMTSTSDPNYDNYILVRLYRPTKMLDRKDICCTLSLEDSFYTSEIFPAKAESEATVSQFFHFLLPEKDSLKAHPNSKMVIGVYPRNISEEMAANLSLPLANIEFTENETVIVPPNSREEEFVINWEELNNSISSLPHEYPLKLRGKNKDDVDDYEVPLLPLLCHRVKVQRHQHFRAGTETLPWEDLMSKVGYRKIPDTQSRAASALPFSLSTPPTPEETGPTEAEVREEVERESQEKIATLSLQHMEEIKQLQMAYEEKINSLSKTLAKVKTEKARQIEDLELTLAEMEKSMITGKKGKSIGDIQRSIARKRKRIIHGLPEWGKDLPDDFFDRLELFKEESVKKQEELIERIKREVSETCEKQLATQHRLAPGAVSDGDFAAEDISLPALFMPTSTTKHLVYTPRAHKYFHPPGSLENRVTQPPAIFKLPALHSGLQTLNLFELSQHFSKSGPQWLKESTHHHQSPRLTPAPPPSACGYHTGTHQITTLAPEKTLFEEDDTDSEEGDTREN